MFCKKVNRGLILGAALLLFLVGFIVVKEVQFKKETPLIRECAEAYLADLCSLQCGVSGQLGKTLPQNEQTAQKAKLDQALGKHWYGNLPDDEYDGIGLSGLRSNYEEYLLQPIEVLFTKAELHLQEDNVRVYKDGPDRAVVGLSADIKTEYTGDGSAFFFGNSNYAVYEDEYSIKGEPSPKAYSGVFMVNMTFELERVAGEWKIVAFNGYGYESTSSEKGE